MRRTKDHKRFAQVGKLGLILLAETILAFGSNCKCAN